MNIENNRVVTLDYRLTDNEGTEISTAERDGLMVYLHGFGELIDVLEAALTGKAKGDQVSVTVPPEDGYGDEDPELIRVMQMDEFNGVEMREGMELQGKDPEGNFRLLRVVKVEGDDVTVNMNHPLAGMTLKFDLEVRDIRDATEAELAHGHVHEDGDEHH